MIRSILLPAVLLFGIASSAQTTVTVEVTLSKPKAGGALRSALCPNPEAYAMEKDCIVNETAANSSVVTLTFTDVAPGTHALKIFHDADGDGKLGTNKLGIPNEPYGFSNDASGTFGPPSFEDAGFVVGKEPVKITVKLKG